MGWYICKGGKKGYRYNDILAFDPSWLSFSTATNVPGCLSDVVHCISRSAQLSPPNLKVEDKHTLLSFRASILHTWPLEPVYSSFCLIWTPGKPRNLHHTGLNSQESGDVGWGDWDSTLQLGMSILHVSVVICLYCVGPSRSCSLGRIPPGNKMWTFPAHRPLQAPITNCLHREEFKGKDTFPRSTNTFPSNLFPWKSLSSF